MFTTFAPHTPSRRLRHAVATAVAVLTAAAGIALPAAAPARATGESSDCTIDFTGAAGSSNWSEPGNWSTGALPAATDVVCITASGLTLDGGFHTVAGIFDDGDGWLNLLDGQLTITGESFVHRLEIGLGTLDLLGDLGIGTGHQIGGELSGAGTLRVFGSFEWHDGTQTGDGTTWLDAGASGVFGNDRSLSDMRWERRLDSRGTVTFHGGNEFIFTKETSIRDARFVGDSLADEVSVRLDTFSTITTMVIGGGVIETDLKLHNVELAGTWTAATPQTQISLSKAVVTGELQLAEEVSLTLQNQVRVAKSGSIVGAGTLAVDRDAVLLAYGPIHGYGLASLGEVVLKADARIERVLSAGRTELIGANLVTEFTQIDAGEFIIDRPSRLTASGQLTINDADRLELHGTIVGNVAHEGGLLVARESAIHGNYVMSDEFDALIEIEMEDGSAPGLQISGDAVLKHRISLTQVDHSAEEWTVIIAASIERPVPFYVQSDLPCAVLSFPGGGTYKPFVKVDLHQCPSMSPATARESAGLVRLTVTIPAPETRPFEMTWGTDDITTDGTSDLPVFLGGVTIPPGETSAVIEIPLADDEIAEGQESFYVTLSQIKEFSKVEVTIVDDDNLDRAPRYLMTMAGSALKPIAATSKGFHLRQVQFGTGTFEWRLADRSLRRVESVVDVNESGDVLLGQSIRRPGGNEVQLVLPAATSSGTQINDVGVVAGTTWTGNHEAVEVVRWATVSAPEIVSPTGGSGTSVADISNAGVIVGTMAGGAAGNHSQPFRIDDGGFEFLSLPPGADHGAATGVNEDGVVSGWAQYPFDLNRASTRAVSWEPDGSLVDLGPGRAYDIADDGIIIGEVPKPGSVRDMAAYVWFDGGDTYLKDLTRNKHGSELDSVRMISSNGLIAGHDLVADFDWNNFFLEPQECFVCVTATVEEAKFGQAAEWMPIGESVFEGTPTRLRMEIDNAFQLGRSITIDVIDITAARSILEEPITKEIAGKGTIELSVPLDTDGWAWAGLAAAGERSLRIEITDGRLGDVTEDFVPVLVNPRPVRLVYGLYDGEATWSALPGHLTARHPRLELSFLEVLDPVDGHRETMVERATRMASLIEETRTALNAWQVDIVGHVDGGLIGRYYTNRLAQPYTDPQSGEPVHPVHRLLLLGTPNSGTPCADLLVTGSMAELRTDAMRAFNRLIGTTPPGVKVSAAVGQYRNVTCDSARPGDGVIPEASVRNGVVDVVDLPNTPHGQMPKSTEAVNRFILPRLAGQVGGNAPLAGPADTAMVDEASDSPTAGEAAAMADSAADSDSAEAEMAATAGTAQSQALYASTLPVAAGATERVGVQVPATATHLAAVYVAPADVRVELVGPDGVVAARSEAFGGEGGKPAIHTARATAAPGRWVARVFNGGGTDADVAIGISAPGVPVELSATARQAHWSGRVAFTATLTRPAAQRPAQLPAQIRDGSESVTDVVLLDDGASGDGTPGDGVYGIVVPGMPDGPVTLAVQIIEPGFMRAATAATVVTVLDSAPDNSAPVAEPQTVVAGGDSPTRVILTGSDADDDDLAFTIVDQPDHGTLTGLLPRPDYVPTPGYRGPDSFSFTVTDGALTSDPATISIEVGGSPTEILLDSSTPTQLTVGQQVTLKVRLIDPNGAAVSAVPVTFAVGSFTATGTSSISGHAGVEYRVALAPGIHELSVSTPGDTNHAAASQTFTLQVSAGAAPAPVITSIGGGSEAGYAIRPFVVANDPDGNAERVEWDFTGDGAVDATSEVDALGKSSAVYTYPATFTGTATISATVIDTTGLRATLTRQEPIASHRPLGSLRRMGEGVLPIDMDSTGRFILGRAEIPGTTNPVEYRLVVIDRTDGSSRVASILPNGEPTSAEIGVLSADGRHVVFGAAAAAGRRAVFARDLTSGTTVEVTAVGDSEPLDTSADGSTVLLRLRSGTLPGTTVCGGCAYVWRRASGEIELASIRTDGAPMVVSGTGGVSDNGVVAVFTSQVGGRPQVFARDLAADTTTLVSVSATGAAGNGESGAAQISGNGRHVVFSSAASDLVAGDTNGRYDVFRRDLRTGTTVLVSKAPAGAADGDSGTPSIDFDGTHVVFSSVARNLSKRTAEQDHADVYLADVAAGTVKLLSQDPRTGLGSDAGSSTMVSGGRAISCDASVVAFRSAATTIVPGDVYFGDEGFADATGVTGRCTPNAAPTAADVTVSTGHNAAVDVTLSGSDPDGDTVAFEIVTQPTTGTLMGTAEARRFTPASGFAGPVTFTYRVGDGELWSAPATVTITVAPRPNQAPTAAPIAASTPHNTAVTVNLRGTDPDGDQLTYQIVTPPVTGTLTGEGVARTFAPAPGFAGDVTFTYRVGDGTAWSEPASVTITVAVAPPPPPPPACRFEGFFAPVDNPPAVNVVNAGSNVPVKFAYCADGRLSILAAGFPASIVHPCGAAPVGPREPANSPGASALTFSGGRYHFNWKTERSWAGQCRTFMLRFNDGSTATATFRFR